MTLDASVSAALLPLPITESAAVQIYHVVHGGVIVCAFAGALFYMVNSKLPTNRQKLVYTFISFIFGYFTAPLIANLLASTLQKTAGLNLQIDLELGALVGAACCVRLLQFVMSYMPFNRDKTPPTPEQPT